MEERGSHRRQESFLHDTTQEPQTAGTPITGEYAARFFDISRSYAEFVRCFAEGTDPDNAIDQWLNESERFWRDMDQGIDRECRTGNEKHGIWNLPLSAWQQTAATLLSPFDEAKANPALGLLDRVLTGPAIGYTREYQEQHQRYTRLALRYAAELHDYQRALARVGLRSIEIFRERLTAIDGEPIRSLRALYDLWVDAGETAYAQYANSSEHSQRFARLINALILLKRETSSLMDKALDGLNLPTRREMDSVHRYLHDMRRENRALRAELHRAITPQRPVHPVPPAPPRRRATRDRQTH